MNPYQQPRQQVVDAAYHCIVKWFVALTMALLVGFLLVPLVLPSDFWRTPSVAVHVPTRDEVQQDVDAKFSKVVKP